MLFLLFEMGLELSLDRLKVGSPISSHTTAPQFNTLTTWACLRMAMHVEQSKPWSLSSLCA